MSNLDQAMVANVPTEASSAEEAVVESTAPSEAATQTEPKPKSGRCSLVVDQYPLDMFREETFPNSQGAPTITVRGLDSNGEKVSTAYKLMRYQNHILAPKTADWGALKWKREGDSHECSHSTMLVPTEGMVKLTSVELSCDSKVLKAWDDLSNIKSVHIMRTTHVLHTKAVFDDESETGWSRYREAKPVGTADRPLPGTLGEEMLKQLNKI